ncbi:MAG: arginine--tRNA ligase, partial [bacterium]|nr:arginine--tRNA ligase [bacterium]
RVIKEEIEKSITEALISLGIETGEFVVEHPTDLKMGDYSTNVGIKTGKAKEIFNHLAVKPPSGVERIELAGPGFINFHLSKEFFKNSLKEIIDNEKDFGKSEHAKGFKVLMEYTSPNLFKPLHIGNLVGNITGESLARIFESSGAEVRRINYPSDIGLTVAKAVWGLKKTQNDPEDIKALGDAYRSGNESYENDPAAKEEIEQINRALYENSDPELTALKDKGIRTSLRHLDSICERFGTRFDKVFFESQSAPIGQEIVKNHIGEVFEVSEGATVFHGGHTRVFLNSQGLPTYEAKELGLFKLKIEEFPDFNMSITVTGTEQKDFFKIVFEAIKKVFPNETKGKILKHIANSFLRLSTGKMSSRKGNTISGEDLVEEVKTRVKGDEQVAIGAIKYMILRQTIGHDIIFDFEKSVSTEGDSGVYLQYAYARTNSLLKKADIKPDPKGERENTHEIEKLLYRFPEIVERAGKEYAPNYITTYLTELSSAFNNFYAHEQVIGDSSESSYRLAIVKAFNIVIKNGLTILGISTPESM